MEDINTLDANEVDECTRNDDDDIGRIGLGDSILIESPMNSLEDKRRNTSGNESASSGNERKKRRRRRRRSRSRSDSSSSICSDGSSFSGTWHEHVYATPPIIPTPHMISDILGWNRDDKNAKKLNNSRVQVGSNAENEEAMRLTVERLVAAPTTSTTTGTPATMPAPPSLKEAPSLLTPKATRYSLESVHQDFTPDLSKLPIPTKSPIDINIPRRGLNNRRLQSSSVNENRKLERRTKLPNADFVKDDDHPLNLSVSGRSSHTADSISRPTNRGKLYPTSQSTFIDPPIETHRGILDRVKQQHSVERNDIGRNQDGKIGDVNLTKELQVSIATTIKGLISFFKLDSDFETLVGS